MRNFQNSTSLDRVTHMIPHSRFLILALSMGAQSEWTTKYLRFVSTLIDGVANRSWESEHQFWDNLFIFYMTALPIGDITKPNGCSYSQIWTSPRLNQQVTESEKNQNAYNLFHFTSHPKEKKLYSFLNPVNFRLFN